MIAVAGGALIALAAGVAAAQTPIDDTLDQRSAKRLDQMEKVVKELRAIVYQGRETGAPVVIQPADTESRLNSQADRLEDLDRSLARLNGEIDILRHDLDESRRQAAEAASANAALSARVGALEQQLKATEPPPPPPPSPSADQPDGAAAAASPGPEAAFNAARKAMLAGDTAAAEAQFGSFLATWPDSPLAPQAHYWLGRALIDRHAWPDAAAAEIAAIRGWPQTSWAPRAVLELSRALNSMGKEADACQTLDELARRYPRAGREIGQSAAALRRAAKCG